MEKGKYDQKAHKKAAYKIMEDREKDQRIIENDNNEEDIFSIEEIKIEEMTIDGICGVY